MTLTDVFDRTFVLNLPHRKDRRREMGAVLRRAGMDWQPGRVELFEATRVAEAGPFPSVGAHGCFLSHLRMLRRGRELGVSRLLLMEDDLEISPGFGGVVDQFARRLAEDDWGFAILGHDGLIRLPSGEAPRLEVIRNGVYTNQFYAVHGAILDRLIAYLEAVLTRPAGHPDGGPMHVDGAFTMFRDQNPDVRTLLACPNLGWQRASSSDITTNWIDRTPVIRSLGRVARLIKRRLERPKA